MLQSSSVHLLKKTISFKRFFLPPPSIFFPLTFPLFVILIVNALHFLSNPVSHFNGNGGREEQLLKPFEKEKEKKREEKKTEERNDSHSEIISSFPLITRRDSTLFLSLTLWLSEFFPSSSYLHPCFTGLKSSNSSFLFFLSCSLTLFFPLSSLFSVYFFFSFSSSGTRKEETLKASSIERPSSSPTFLSLLLRERLLSLSLSLVSFSR